VKPELEKLARHRLTRAKDAFGEGEHLLTKGSSMGAVNRFYYAGFYAARALLALRELDSSRHADVISLFQKHFEEAERVHRLGSTHAAFDDVQKFTPVDPIQYRAGASLLLVVKSALNDLPAGFAVIGLTRAKLSRTSFSFTARLFPVLSTEILG
jgi:uncharacterized protein (UPF0332 family)